MFGHLRAEASEDRPEVVGAEAGGGGDGLGDAQRRGGLDDDVLGGGHGGAPLECSEVGFDPAQPGVLVGQVLLDLGAAQPQHPPELLDRRRLSLEQVADLLEAEIQVPQGQQAVEANELGHAVGAVAGGGVDALGTQEAEPVVVPQHARRDLAEPGELSDARHDEDDDAPSRRVKVERGSGWRRQP